MSTQATATVLVSIPGPVASSSKMAKKGWKCWAKRLTSVATPANDGYAFEGEFVTIEAKVECRLGDVILHVDQSDSAAVGVVMVNRNGTPIIKWIETASPDGRKWCGTLAAPARRLLDMDSDARVRFVALSIITEERATQLNEEAAAYWRSVAGMSPSESATTTDAVETVTQLDAAMMSIETILSQLNGTDRAEAIRRVAAIQRAAD